MLIRLIVPGEIARVEDLNTSLEAVLTRHGIDAGVRGDVRLIVEELASNAIEHGEGRDVVLTIGANQTAVAVTVRDHGVGFSATQAHQVFTRFWRADSSRQRTVGGSGLGLSIAKAIVTAHHGTITVTSEPGATVFEVSLPARPADPAV